jgi:hypothetical protein
MDSPNKSSAFYRPYTVHAASYLDDLIPLIGQLPAHEGHFIFEIKQKFYRDGASASVSRKQVLWLKRIHHRCRFAVERLQK